MKPIKRLFVILLLTVVSLNLVHAQEFSIRDFFLAQTDLTANTPGTMVRDQNGRLCALIKVETPLDDLTYNVGILGITETKRVGGEFWVYVPFGIRKISISHQEFGMIRDFYFPVDIESGRTYILKLNTPASRRTYDSSKTQMLVLEVEPKEAKVRINYSPVKLDDGVFEEEYFLGKYDLDVTAERYHDLKTTIEISDPDSPCYVNVSLKPKFGWLTINCEGDEKLYLDDQRQFFTPGIEFDLNSSTYRVRLEKPLHKPYETTVSITDSLSVMLNPVFVPVYRDLSLTVGRNAQIWINGIHVGNGTYREKLEYGTYNVECRLSRHTTTSKVLTVGPETTGPIVLDTPEPLYKVMTFEVGSEAEIWLNNSMLGTGRVQQTLDFGTYTLEARKTSHTPSYMSLTVGPDTPGTVSIDTPKPILSELKVTSSPDGAQVFLDNNLVGVTPYTAYTLVGTYKLEVKKSGYNTVSKTVTIEENKPSTVNAVMNRNMPVMIYSDPNATVYLDGKRIGDTPNTFIVQGGKHKMTLIAQGYMTKRTSVEFTEANQKLRYKLKKLTYETPTRFEISAGFTAGLGDFTNDYSANYYPEKLGSKVYFGAELSTGLLKADVEERYAEVDGVQELKKFRRHLFTVTTGYTANVGAKFQVSPTAGFGIVALPQEDVDSSILFKLGVKLNMALMRGVELYVTPQYYFPAGRSDGHNDLCQMFPSYDHADRGLKLSFGLTLFMND